VGIGVQGEPGAVVAQMAERVFTSTPFCRARTGNVCLRSWNLILSNSFGILAGYGEDILSPQTEVFAFALPYGATLLRTQAKAGTGRRTLQGPVLCNRGVHLFSGFLGF